MTDREMRLRILEAIAPVLAARSNNSSADLETWKKKMTQAMDELFEHAEALVFANKSVGNSED